MNQFIHPITPGGVLSAAGAIVLGGLFFLTGPARAEEPYHTPLAGDAYHTTLFGEEVNVAPRDRTNLTALNLGLYYVPDIKEEVVTPFGTLYFWRNFDDGKTILRAVVSVVYNDVRYTVTPPALGGLEVVFTLHNFTVPVAQSEYVEGVEIDDALYWLQWNLGFGLGYSTKLAPGFQDNILDVSLTYEPGMLTSRKSSETLPGYVVPQNTYEGRVHFRFRADAMTRNIMELAHHGLSGGVDVIYGNRTDWNSWGGDAAFGMSGGASHRNWLTAAAYAVAAGDVPFVQDERHRLIAQLHAGVGSHVDRFSALRINGGPGGDEAEALSRVILPAGAFDEFFTPLYGIASLEYRYELLFFLYLHLKGDLAAVERYRFDTPSIQGPASYQLNTMPSVTAGLTSGFIWNSELEVYFTHSFSMLRDIDRNPQFGGNSLVVSWSREF